MLVAHLPSGYLVGNLLRRKWPGSRAVMAAALVGSVIPDADMLYFHLIDGGRTHHHDYVTHWPLFWLALAAIALPFVFCLRRGGMPACTAFFTGVMVHMVLDTVAAPLKWLMPLSDRSFELVTVPAIYGHWTINFILHWTFGLELAICAVAVALWLRGRKVVPSAMAATD